MDLPLRSPRIESIDLLRGVVIVIMALDHVRDYFHADAFLFDPTDMGKTSVALFFTRFITHFCAPVFIFLAGTSAYQVGLRKGKKELSAFLLKRGLWLIVLEVTVINFAWFFNIHFSFIALIIIWALGMGMIILAGLIWLPRKVILVIAVLLIVLHNISDRWEFVSPAGSIIFGLLHKQSGTALSDGRILFFGYGLIPWVAVMALGYCFGSMYEPSYDPGKRRKLLMTTGVVALVVFVILRYTNAYGDPNPWEYQSSAMFTFLSFINIHKYPPSLLYLLLTLGIAFIFLAGTERISNKITAPLVVIGRVPLFFYVVHIYVIHIAALIAAVATGFPASAMTFNTWITNSAALKGYGFSLGSVYLVWILIILLLYPACKWFDEFKRSHRAEWWTSYI